MAKPRRTKHIKRKPATHRCDLLQWRRKEEKLGYEQIAERAKVSVNAAWKTVGGKGDPSASTMKAVYKAMGLDPKFALDDRLEEIDFHLAVL